MTGENTMYMPVAPAYNGDGMFGGNSAWWIIILLIFGGWGNGWGNQGNMGADIQRGFDQATLTNGLTNVQTALCNGFAGVSNGFAQAEISANARQMADMNQNFAIQTGISDLKYTIASEACSTRAASSADRQMIMDKLCQLEMDGYRQQLAEAQRVNDQLRTQLLVANNQASQTAQTAQILADNAAQTAALEQYLAPVPRPAYWVQNPNGCNCNQTCNGCTP